MDKIQVKGKNTKFNVEQLKVRKCSENSTYEQKFIGNSKSFTWDKVTVLIENQLLKNAMMGATLKVTAQEIIGAWAGFATLTDSTILALLSYQYSLIPDEVSLNFLRSIGSTMARQLSGLNPDPIFRVTASMSRGSSLSLQQVIDAITVIKPMKVNSDIEKKLLVSNVIPLRDMLLGLNTTIERLNTVEEILDEPEPSGNQVLDWDV